MWRPSFGGWQSSATHTDPPEPSRPTGSVRFGSVRFGSVGRVAPCGRPNGTEDYKPIFGYHRDSSRPKSSRAGWRLRPGRFWWGFMADVQVKAGRVKRCEVIGRNFDLNIGGMVGLMTSRA